MAVRELDGVDDEIVMSVGALSGITYGTVGILTNRLASSRGDTLIRFHSSTSDYTNRLNLEWTGFNDILFETSAGASAGYGTDTGWCLLVARKATGSATPRVSVYKYATSSWSHFNLGSSIADATSPGAGGSARFRGPFGSLANLRVAVRGVWSNALPWSADTTGDTALQSSGLKDTLQKWVDATPSALWAFNQTSTAAPVTDITGGGADQSSITGTTVISGDDPPGFNFALGGATLPPRPVVAPPPSVTRASCW